MKGGTHEKRMTQKRTLEDRRREQPNLYRVVLELSKSGPRAFEAAAVLLAVVSGMGLEETGAAGEAEP